MKTPTAKQITRFLIMLGITAGCAFLAGAGWLHIPGACSDEYVWSRFLVGVGYWVAGSAFTYWMIKREKCK